MPILKLIAKIHGGIMWLQGRLSKKQFIFLSSVLVGLTAGMAAIVLKTFAHYIFRLATFNETAHFPFLLLFLPFLGILLTVLVVKKLFHNKFEKGLSNILFAIAQKSSIVPRVQMYAQVVTSSLTVGLGGSAGLEAPIVVTGAAFGSNYARTYRLDYKERTLLLACGIAAGIAAAFNAPIAGVLFALEVLLLDVSISAFTPLIIAAASGALISKIILNDDILLSFQLQKAFDYHNVPFYVLLGVFAGIVSVYHSRTFTRAESYIIKKIKSPYRKVVFGGIALAILIYIFPSLFGEGYESIKMLSQQRPEKLLDNSVFHNFKNNEWFVLLFVGALVFVKAFATAITLGSGGNGGNFAPSLFVGAYLGFFFSRFFNMLDITRLPENNFTLAGMAGILSGLYHAPLTAIFLIAEITGGYTLMIPLMIVSSISFAISRSYEKYSMDAKKLASRGQIFTSDKDRNILSSLKMNNLIETDFKTVGPENTLGDLVEAIAASKRNIFPVVKENQLIGIILLDNIREIIFKNELYEKVWVKDLMTRPPGIIDINESMESAMKKFDDTGAWNLPVVHDGKYVGFISKSNVFSYYRTQLKTNIIE